MYVDISKHQQMEYLQYILKVSGMLTSQNIF